MFCLSIILKSAKRRPTFRRNFGANLKRAAQNHIITTLTIYVWLFLKKCTDSDIFSEEAGLVTWPETAARSSNGLGRINKDWAFCIVIIFSFIMMFLVNDVFCWFAWWRKARCLVHRDRLQTEGFLLCPTVHGTVRWEGLQRLAKRTVTTQPPRLLLLTGVRHDLATTVTTQTTKISLQV